MDVSFWYYSSIFVHFFTFLHNYRYHFFIIILLLDWLHWKGEDFESIIYKYGSIYQWKKGRREIYWPSLFIIEIFTLFRIDWRRNSINLFLTILFLYYFQNIIIYSLLIFLFIFFTSSQFFIFSIPLTLLLSKIYIYEVKIEKFNKYEITFVECIQYYLFYYPKALAFIISYFFFSGGDKKESFKKDFKMVIYYRVLGLPLVWIDIIAFIFTLINRIISGTEWRKKKMIAHPFIFFYELSWVYKSKINENNSSFFSMIKNRRIIVDKVISTNDPKLFIIKTMLRDMSKEQNGPKLAAYLAHKDHATIINPSQNINEIGASYSTVLTHAKMILAKPFAIDSRIQIPTSLHNAQMKQYSMVTFLDNNLLHLKEVKNYYGQFLNEDQRLLSEAPLKIEQIIKSHDFVVNKAPILYQSTAKIIATAHELSSKGYISKSAQKLVMETNPLIYEKYISLLTKNFPGMTEKEARKVILEANHDFKNASLGEQIAIYVDAEIEGGHLNYRERDVAISAIKFDNY